MKIKPLILAGAATLVASVPALYAANNSAGESPAPLGSVRTAELPREVARLVGNEKGNGRAERAVAIVRHAVEVNRAAAPAIVGAAARVAPDLAAQFSAAAVTVEPKLAAGIARAAAAAAPSYAGEIAAAVVKIHPVLYAQVAYEIAYAVSNQDQQIVNGVVAGLPNLKPFTGSATVTELLASTPRVDKAARQLGMQTDEFLLADLTPAQLSTVKSLVASSTPSVASAASVNRPAVVPVEVSLLSPSADAPLAAKVTAASATKGVPFVPGAGTPGEDNRAQVVVVTPGEGRTYDKPGNGPKDKNDDGKPGNGPKK